MGELDREPYNSIRIKGEIGKLITPLGEEGEGEREMYGIGWKDIVWML